VIGRSVNDLIERRSREAEGDGEGERFVPVAVDFELEGETLLSVGGRWDRRSNDYDGEASVAVIVRIHPGQRAAVEWFKRWLDAHAERRENATPMTKEERAAFEDRLENGDVSSVDTDDANAFAALFAGGRRAGKTWIAVALASRTRSGSPARSSGSLRPPTRRPRSSGDTWRRARAEWIDRETEAMAGSSATARSCSSRARSTPRTQGGQGEPVFLNEGQR
jgi:hypothetical protein